MSLLKTHIEFRSDNFPQTSEEQKNWDGQIWGYTLAKYLSEELPKHGVTVSEFLNEDWGYLIPLATNPTIYAQHWWDEREMKLIRE